MSFLTRRTNQKFFAACKSLLNRISAASKLGRHRYKRSMDDDESWSLIEADETEDIPPMPGSYTKSNPHLPCPAPKHKIRRKPPPPVHVGQYGKICPNIVEIDTEPQHASATANTSDTRSSSLSETESSTLDSDRTSLYTCTSTVQTSIVPDVHQDLDIYRDKTSPAPTSSSFRSLPVNWAPGQPLPYFATNHIKVVDPESGACVTVLGPRPPRRPLNELRRVIR
ncbi:hypothetical protein H0H93_011876 [Arthromyces matolae]|nr:hypothetical protein H0H93_011876 [Arthromyces matolae]